jgi:uncharacterized cupin superfamily protein
VVMARRAKNAGMKKVHFPSLPEIEQRSPTGKFHSYCRNVSLALGGIRNSGPAGGGHPFDLQLRRIPPGAAVCPFHLHFGQWELFVVHSGVGTVRTSEGFTEVKTGEVFFHPPGTPHQLLNRGSVDLEVLIITDNPPVDACYYPDSDKWALRPPGKCFRMTEVGYFDGEEAAPTSEVVGAYHPPTDPAAPPGVPFSQRSLHPDRLAWEPWTSPKGKFGGSSKELSIALGAKRRTPSGLGGHPFDLELSKLAPGECGCPFHSHALQWEMFVILAGSAAVRMENESVVLGPGDVVLHSPGEAHQITNASDREELVFWLIADNPPVDYWHYPDSKKFGLSAPRQFFRPTETDYWDGEE